MATPPHSIALNATSVPTTRPSPNQTAPLVLPLLVLPPLKVTRSDPECPFDVARTLASTVAVFTVLVYAVVANVTGSAGVSPLARSSEKKTRAKPGAGTGIVQAFAS